MYCIFCGSVKSPPFYKLSFSLWMALNWCQKYSFRISTFLLRNHCGFFSPGDVHMLPMKSFQKVLHTEGPGLWDTVCQSLGHHPCLEAASIHLFLWVPFHNILRWLGNLMVIERASFLLVGLVGSLIQSLKPPTNVYTFIWMVSWGTEKRTWTASPSPSPLEQMACCTPRPDGLGCSGC